MICRSEPIITRSKRVMWQANRFCGLEQQQYTVHRHGSNKIPQDIESCFEILKLWRRKIHIYCTVLRAILTHLFVLPNNWNILTVPLFLPFNMWMWWLGRIILLCVCEIIFVSSLTKEKVHVKERRRNVTRSAIIPLR